MKIHDDIEQHTPEWEALRVGRITGTRIKEMAGGQPKTVETLCRKIAAEILTGKSSDKFYINGAMQHGIDTEDEARSAYEIEKLCIVKEVGFISKDELFGVSPDGLVDKDGLVEIKCPLPSTHIGYLLSPEPHRSYRWQLQGQLWVSGREHVDFVSYCPGFKDGKELLIKRVRPNKEDSEELDIKADFCRKRIDEILRSIK